MSDPAAPIDPKVFAQAARLFARKGSILPPPAVEGFAREVVARLANSARRVARPGPIRIDPDDLAAFCDLLLKPDQPRQVLAFVQARMADGARPEDIYLGYIAESARQLGRRWEAGELSVLDVAIGAGTLYALMRAMPAASPAGRPPDQRRAALFATVPGEQHGIGITVAAGLFRQRGWDIDLQIGLDHDGLLAWVEHTRPGIVGLSLSTRARLADLVRAVVALRLAVSRAVIGVAHGGDLTAADLRSVADVDIVFDDAPSAIALLERRIAAPPPG